MSNQSSVYSEKKIAAYESLFKESNFAKPQEVYLTITVAHLFGQAYILEQEGTKEGDPVYSRFVCALEDITKVYVNDKIKKPWPLFIQCDNNVKGVVHRKRIVIPCLENPIAIADQINEVKNQHMQKYEAAMEREKQRKREELESARMKEQLESGAKARSDEDGVKAEKKYPEIIVTIEEPESVKKAKAEAAAEKAAAEKAAEEKAAAEKAEAEKAEDEKEISVVIEEAPAETDMADKAEAKKDVPHSVSELNSVLEDSFKEFEKFDKHKDDKPLPEIEVVVEEAPAPAAEEPVPEAVEEAPAVEETAPAAEEAAPEEIIEEKSAEEEIIAEAPAAAVEDIAPAEEVKAEETAPEAEAEADIPAVEAISIDEIAPLSVEEELSASAAAEGLEAVQSASDEIEELPTLGDIEEVPAPVPEPEIVDSIPDIVLEELAPAEVSKPAPEPAPAPAPEPVREEAAPAPAVHEPRVNPNGKASELVDFEAAVLKLKSMKDNGLLSDEEFASEKKNLIATLY